VPREEISRALSKGMDVIVKVDIQGASTIKKILPQAVFIFLMPPSMEELERRLKQRQSELSMDLSLRLEEAEEEIKKLSFFDYGIISYQDELEEVVSQIEAIVIAEKCRVKPKMTKL